MTIPLSDAEIHVLRHLIHVLGTDAPQVDRGDIRVPTPTATRLLEEIERSRAETAIVVRFLEERATFTTSMINSNLATPSDTFHRWVGQAQARRDLAEALRWPVPHGDKDGVRVDHDTGAPLHTGGH